MAEVGDGEKRGGEKNQKGKENGELDGYLTYYLFLGNRSAPPPAEVGVF